MYVQYVLIRNFLLGLEKKCFFVNFEIVFDGVFLSLYHGAQKELR